MYTVLLMLWLSTWRTT